MDFIAFDLETTGTVPGVDQIVEIGAVRFINGNPESVFSTLVNPGRPIPPEATAVNKITNEMLVGKPNIESLLPAFAEFCGDMLMVAHNSPFDTQFLVSDIKKYEQVAPLGVVVDTLPMARKIVPGLANYKLGTLVAHFKIPAGEYHRAEEDATYCGHLFNHLIKKVSVNGQPPKVENLIALTGKPEFRFPQIEKQPKQLDLLSFL